MSERRAPEETSPVAFNRILRGAALLTVGALLVQWLRHGWVTEDAYITLRTIDNFVEGHGLRWNVDERVQVYTHPLWLFVLTPFYALTREAYLTTMAVGVLTSGAAAVVLALRVGRTPMLGLAGVVLLGFSRAFSDFSTSGLENPLTHLLIALFAWVLFHKPASRGSIFWLALVGALLSLNRLDTTLIYAPALAYAMYRGVGVGVKPRRLVRPLLLAFAPLILWEVFSLWYYGFPFPNTAYAKISTGISGWELWAQGGLYLLDSLTRDPVTTAYLFGALLFVVFDRDRFRAFLMGGVVLYLIYVMKVGGDFMAGRFLSAPFMATVCALVGRMPSRAPVWVPALLLIPALLLSTANLGRVGHFRPRAVAGSGVADERMFYLDGLSLPKISRDRPAPDHGLVRHGQRLRTGVLSGRRDRYHLDENVGLKGYAAGPSVHIVDRIGLTDPLIARLPARRELPWRIGHYHRQIPSGYLRTLASGECHFEDEGLCTYWRHLRQITSGSLFSLSRLVTIVKMNLGLFDHLIPYDQLRNPGLIYVAQEDFDTRRAWGTRLDAPGVLSFGIGGAAVLLTRVEHAPRLSLSVSADDGHEVVFVREGRRLATERLPPLHGGGLMVVSIPVPEDAADEGYDTVRLYPYRGDGSAQLGHLVPTDADEEE